MHKDILHAIRKQSFTLATEFWKKLLSYQTILVLTPPTNLGIDHGIAPIILAQQTLLTPATKEVVEDAEPGGAWINMNLRQLIRRGVNWITPGGIYNPVSVVEPSYQVLIGMFITSPQCGLNVIQEVRNK